MIDFQARIDNDSEYPFLVALNTARWAMTVIDQNFDYICSVHKLWDGIASHVEYRKTGEAAFFDFDLAGRTIDASMLEELHNDVTAWFTAIKEGVK